MHQKAPTMPTRATEVHQEAPTMLNTPRATEVTTTANTTRATKLRHTSKGEPVARAIEMHQKAPIQGETAIKAVQWVAVDKQAPTGLTNRAMLPTTARMVTPQPAMGNRMTQLVFVTILFSELSIKSIKFVY